MGCWKDDESRMIPTLEGTDSILDGEYTQRTDKINKCKIAAMKRGTIFVYLF